MDDLEKLKAEFRQAIKEKRQPNCPVCGEPLAVGQTLYEFVSWKWDDEVKRYISHPTGHASSVECQSCDPKSSSALADKEDDDALYHQCRILGLDY